MRSSAVGLFGDRATVTTVVVATPCAPTNFLNGTYQLDVSETDCQASYPDYINQCSSGRAAPTLEIGLACTVFPPGACDNDPGVVFIVTLRSGLIPYFGSDTHFVYIPDKTSPIHVSDFTMGNPDSPLTTSISFDLDPTTGVVTNFSYRLSSPGRTEHDLSMAGSGSFVFVCDTQ